MKTLKIKKGPIIFTLIMCALFLATGIVFALLPEEVYIGWGDYDSAHTRYYPLIFCSVFIVIFLLVLWLTVVRQKKENRILNGFMRKLGDDTIAFYGSIRNPERTKENAKKTAISVIGGFLASLFFGIGVFKVYQEYNARIFILYREGMYAINPQNGSQTLIHKTESKRLNITEKRSKIHVELVGTNISFLINTRGLDVSKDQLTAQLHEVFETPNGGEQVAAVNSI